MKSIKLVCICVFFYSCSELKTSSIRTPSSIHSNKSSSCFAEVVNLLYAKSFIIRKRKNDSLIGKTINQFLRKAIQSRMKTGIELEVELDLGEGKVIEEVQKVFGGKISGRARFYDQIAIQKNRKYYFNIHANNLFRTMHILEVSDKGGSDYFYGKSKLVAKNFEDALQEVQALIQKDIKGAEVSATENVGLELIYKVEVDGKDQLVSFLYNKDVSVWTLQKRMVEVFGSKYPTQVDGAEEFEEIITKMLAKSPIQYIAPKITGSEIGEINFDYEVSHINLNENKYWEEIDGLEIITEPLLYENALKMKLLLRALRAIGLKGTPKKGEKPGQRLGMHINNSASDKENFLRDLLKSLGQDKEEILSYFSPDPKRLRWIKDFGMPENHMEKDEFDFLYQLRVLPAEGKENAINPYHLVVGNRPAIEWRIYDSMLEDEEFEDALDFSLAYTYKSIVSVD